MLVRRLVRATLPGHRLFPFSPAVFRKALRRACGELQLSSAYTPHSLRHGGATYWHNNLGRSMEDIMHRGRWASSKSARLYVQQGPAVWMDQHVPRSTYAIGLAASRQLYPLFVSLAQSHFVGVGITRPPAAAAAARTYPLSRAFL